MQQLQQCCQQRGYIYRCFNLCCNSCNCKTFLKQYNFKKYFINSTRERDSISSSAELLCEMEIFRFNSFLYILRIFHLSSQCVWKRVCNVYRVNSKFQVIFFFLYHVFYLLINTFNLNLFHYTKKKMYTFMIFDGDKIMNENFSIQFIS